MITELEFGKITLSPYAKGKTAKLYLLSAPGNPFSLTVSDYGATVVAACLADGEGKQHPIVRGYDSLGFYERAEGYLGAVVGRFGNRIAKGRFTLDGTDYTLYTNNGVNHLHGGRYGFDKKLYSALLSDGNEPYAEFSSFSPDGEEGYPGNLSYSVRYTLVRGGFTVSYRAETDAPTPLNLTNHTYFNLDGEGVIEDHLFTIDADRYLPTDETLIPTGILKKTSGSPFDFGDIKSFGSALSSDDPDIETAGGIDHCFVFPDEKTGFLPRAVAVSEKSGIRMVFSTDRPAVQVYTGNFLGDPDFPFSGGERQKRRAAFCLESEGFPDAPNHTAFPDCILRPGEVFRSLTGYTFDFLK